MKRLFLPAFLFCVSLLHAALPDTLNQYSNHHKKDGFWIQYLDSVLNPCDSVNAYFYGYEKYDKGEDVFRFPRATCTDTSWYRFEYSGPAIVKGKPILLNGTFSFYFKKETPAGLLAEYQVYKDGRPVYWNAYHRTKNDTACTFNEVLDWRKPFEGTDGTFYYEEITHIYETTNDAIVTYSGYFRKGKKGWKTYGSKTKGLKEKYGLITIG